LDTLIISTKFEKLTYRSYFMVIFPFGHFLEQSRKTKNNTGYSRQRIIHFSQILFSSSVIQ